MIAWAQEVERYCDRTRQAYEDVASFYDEIKFFPQVKYFPGVIGGHCVMPNIEILRKFDDSTILKAIRASNHKKIERELAKGFEHSPNLKTMLKLSVKERSGARNGKKTRPQPEEVNT